MSSQLRMAMVVRLLAALLALAAFALAGLRLYALSGEVVGPADGVMHSLRIFFPASIGLLLGYLALKGRLPFDDRRSGEEDGNGANG
ncbi:MAG TPA: hypothetical protein ENK54_05455 [Thiotrichales bacterium]|nr:hypothetical protein [Thiotrichales bacterium]